jgi:Domain of unknown function (DUF4258)
VYPKILQAMRECVRQNRLILTIHAIEEMDADDLLKEDLENAILYGEIVRRQWDKEFIQYKYLIDGEALSGIPLEVVAKLRDDNTVIITAYVL